MRYEGMIYRPPSEARSYLLQVTVGCSHNKCRFCNMYKAKDFHVRHMSDIMEDLEMARAYYRHVGKIFLCDGDALCLSTEKLMRILDRISELFPECGRVAAYGSAANVGRKTDEELETLKGAGLDMIYIGAESGSDRILSDMNKGSTRAEIITAVKRIENAGIPASVTFISGLGGRPMWREHAVETGTMISEMEPSFVGFLTLMLEPGAPLRKDVIDGTFELLTAEEVVDETMLMLENINVTKRCVFRSDHASNYVILKGDLPDDKERMLKQLERAAEDTGLLRDERFRAL